MIYDSVFSFVDGRKKKKRKKKKKVDGIKKKWWTQRENDKMLLGYLIDLSNRKSSIAIIQSDFLAFGKFHLMVRIGHSLGMFWVFKKFCVFEDILIFQDIYWNF